jgi:hypothetical protein
MSVGADKRLCSRISSFKKISQPMQALALLIAAALLLPVSLNAQSAASEVQSILSREVQPKQAVTFQLQQYLLKREPVLPHPSGAEQWSADAEKVRTHLLDDVVFHGWPKAWINAPSKVENLGEIPGGKGFRRWKLRYEVVPGLDATAILYAPEPLHGKVPGILVVMGHWGDLGNTMEFNQNNVLTMRYAGRSSLIQTGSVWVN